MTVALAVALGLVTPYLLRRMDNRAPTVVVIAAHLAALMIVWLGILDIAVGATGLSHRLVEFCTLALHDPPAGGNLRVIVVMTVVIAAMVGRAAHLWWRTAQTTRRARRRLLTMATGRIRDVTFAPMGSVACTVGLLRPRVFVDNTMFPALRPSQRAAARPRARTRSRTSRPDRPCGKVHGCRPGAVARRAACAARRPTASRGARG